MKAIFFSSKKFTREPVVSLYLYIIFALYKCYSVAHLQVCKWARIKSWKNFEKLEIIKICWNFKFHKAIDEIYSFFFSFFCYKTKHTYSYNRTTCLTEMMRLNMSKIIQNSNLSQKLSTKNWQYQTFSRLNSITFKHIHTELKFS